MTKILPRAKIKAKLIGSNWQLKKVSLVSEIKAKDFEHAIEIINKVAKVAETLNHHPDITLRKYNRLKFETTSHSAGGITQKDLDLALKIDRLVKTPV